MALGGNLIKPHTALQQLLDEINFQRTKELRQLQREDGGFVMLQGTTYWTDLFVRHFLFQSETQHPIDSDDLLFFVRKKHIKGSSRHMPKFDTEIDVFRKDSRKLPIGDPDVDWEETVYLNLVIHQFNYTVTLAICTRTSPKELQVLRRHSQRVYASPSRRKMDTKGDSEEITYPHICFMVDNFDEVFSDILVRDGEMVCVELVASDRDGSVQGVIFLGSIRYDALKKVYDSRQSSLSTKVAQRMTFGLFSSGGPQTRCEFVRMKGPQGKGHAEMAVTKPKGSGVETPTSEPGISAADMWDSEWDEDPDDFYNYRHQRRLSDPSASLNNFSRYAFRTKGSHNATAGEKARSENEGLDILVNEVSEIEAGDLRDDCPASSSVSQTKIADGTVMAQSQPTTIKATETAIITTPTTCCNCFANRKRWSDSLSMQMSDVYCRTCDEGNLSPSCLVNVTTPWKFQKYGFNKNVKTLLNVESEIELPSTKKQNKKIKNSASSGSSGGSSSASNKCSNKNQQCRVDKKQDQHNATKSDTHCKSNGNNNKELEYELADDATFLNDDNIEINSIHDGIIKVGIIKEFDSKLMIRVHGQEEVPEIQHTLHILDNKQQISNECQVPKNKYNNLIKFFKNDLNGNLGGCSNNNNNNTNNSNNSNNNNNNSNHNNNSGIRLTRQYSTLPKRSKRQLNPYSNTDKLLNLKTQSILKVPTRITPDGTKIIYWCDMSKKVLKELDDGAYNPLWASKGFTQTFHFWKEHRRQQSTPLNAFLTYITLPWWSIAKDLIDHRETPILTF